MITPTTTDSGDEAKFPSILPSNNPVKEDVGSECQSDSKCLPSTDCPYYRAQQNLLTFFTDKTIKINIVQHLRSLTCNRQQNAVCCPTYEFWPEFCYLPPEYHGAAPWGTAKFLEDCDTLGKIHLSTNVYF